MTLIFAIEIAVDLYLSVDDPQGRPSDADIEKARRTLDASQRLATTASWQKSAAAARKMIADHS